MYVVAGMASDVHYPSLHKNLSKFQFDLRTLNEKPTRKCTSTKIQFECYFQLLEQRYLLTKRFRICMGMKKTEIESDCSFLKTKVHRCKELLKVHSSVVKMLCFRNRLQLVFCCLRFNFLLLHL